ncbi:MAG: acetylxylan esterase [Sediminibacterium sp.]|jgi:cephalosporin-C deacetylase|nr:acetylxylan esterase [Chitinophagaceae bacterium]MCA6448469.1 acetylxylan esterase [Chitinophagaceae bacterium]
MNSRVPKQIRLSTALWYCYMLAFTSISVFCAAQPPLKGISYDIRPFRKEAIFRNDEKVGYDVRLKNNTGEKIRGTLKALVKNYKGEQVFNQEMGFTMDARRSFSTDLKLENNLTVPGFYQLMIAINAGRYNDTLYYGYGVDPEKIYSNVNRPSDFDQFWEDAKRDLINIDPKFRVTRRGDQSTRDVDVFLVEFQSLDYQTIRGWLSVPKEKGKFKVMYELPGYLQDMRPDSLRKDMAVFRLNVRGHGNSKDNTNADFNTFNIINLNDKNKYIYRGVYMDALRGLEFIYRHEHLKLDIKKVVVKGEGQGAVLAAVVSALDNRPQGCVLERPVYVDMRTLFFMAETQKVKPWPVLNFQAYINNPRNRLNKENLFRIWDYFDPVNFAPNIRCKVLFGHNMKNTVCPPQAAIALYNQIRIDNREIYMAPDEEGMNYIYYSFENFWIKRIL